MNWVSVAGKTVRLDPSKAVGKGGEADVFRFGRDRVIKIWKTPEHSDYQGLPGEQAVARERIALQQEKLPAFPGGLPDRVVAPDQPALDLGNGLIAGYSMARVRDSDLLVRFSERSFREKGVPSDRVRRIFEDLHGTLVGLHRRGVVVGDFNDLNVLVKGESAFVIDADSFQFGRFSCRMFTQRFLDPLLCDPGSSALALAGCYSPESDWYAYSVMLMRSLLFVGPYGGVFRPADPSHRVAPQSRPLERITVFHPEVRYPKPAVPYEALPDDLLQEFHRVFVEDRRGVFPLPLLVDLRWASCPGCGTEHARGLCPVCTQVTPATVRTTSEVHGKVIVTHLRSGHGRVLQAAAHGGGLAWIEYRDGAFHREDGRKVVSGSPTPGLEIHLCGEETVIASSGRAIRLGPGSTRGEWACDGSPAGTAVYANSRRVFWAEGGWLMRDGSLGPVRLGRILPGLTRFFVGERFGFGFYLAGELSVAFVFDAERSGLDDSLHLPPLRGQLIDARCVFADDRCWFFSSCEQSGRLRIRCLALSRSGQVLGEAEAEAGDPGWLGSMTGQCAAGTALLAPTDEGIVRVEVDGGRLVTAASFPDTEAFVTQESRLLVCDQGLAAIAGGDIRMLRMS